jgi:hypothetical protein
MLLKGDGRKCSRSIIEWNEDDYRYWCGGTPHSVAFPRLFAISEQQECLVSEMGELALVDVGMKLEGN